MDEDQKTLADAVLRVERKLDGFFGAFALAASVAVGDLTFREAQRQHWLGSGLVHDVATACLGIVLAMSVWWLLSSIYRGDQRLG